MITFEFPHLLRLIENNQFDTIYHEHFSYLSFLAVEKIFAHHGLTLFDVEELPTHGGSLRIFARHTEEPITYGTDRVHKMKEKEDRLWSDQNGDLHRLWRQGEGHKTKTAGVPHETQRTRAKKSPRMVRRRKVLR